MAQLPQQQTLLVVYPIAVLYSAAPFSMISWNAWGGLCNIVPEKMV